VAFNAHHSPIGAYATLTLGTPGRSGFGVESGIPPEHELLAGVLAADGIYEALPFFVARPGDPLRGLAPVTRDFGLVTDTWAAPHVSLRVVTPLRAVPEPGAAPLRALRDALVPAVLVELTVDNLASDEPRRAFFGVRAATGPHARSPWGPTPRLRHAHARDYGFVLDDGAGRSAGAFTIAPEASAAAGTDIAAVLGGPPGGSGNVAAVRFDVPAGEQVSYLIAVAFWHDGPVTRGEDRECSYWYTRLFADIEDAAAHALEGFQRLEHAHTAAAAELDAAPLSEPQRFQLAHAVRSYYGNTALLGTPQGHPLWAVIEGEFMFVNTLDLAVDQLFFELRQGPWTVRNELDGYLERHSRRDEAGLAFTHDMGAFPGFSEPGTSAYEQGVRMTGEELTNWTLAALVYIAQTGDEPWAAAHAGTLEQCLASLLARSPDGVPAGEDEDITTYDSLDASLRQVRSSTYLAGKQWAACVCLSAFFAARGRDTPAARAIAHARLMADRMVAAAEDAGYLPALLTANGHTGARARVIPVVEGLVYPLFGGAAHALDPAGRYGDYVRMLREHLRAVLAPDACRFPDGGWKLTSAHDNTWLSKVYLCQFVARRILGLPPDPAADEAHAAWLRDDPAGWAWSDQVLAGAVHLSHYYPRGVTAALWLEEHPSTARLSAAPTVRLMTADAISDRRTPAVEEPRGRPGAGAAGR
jgi:hypothetical protein